MNKQIKYPIFLKCTPYCVDPYWLNIFERLAYGEPPTGCYMTNEGYLHCYKQRKKYTYHIDNNKKSLTIYQDIKNLFSSKLGIISLKEKMQYKQKTKDTHKEIKCWNDIKKKSARELLILCYIIKLGKNLSVKKIKELSHTLNLYLQIKVIKNSDIIYDTVNNNIKKIKNVYINENGELIVDKILFDDFNLNNKDNECNNNNSRIDVFWDKYIKDIGKKSIKRGYE